MTAMRGERHGPRARPALIAALAGAVLGGCGGGKRPEAAAPAGAAADIETPPLPEGYPDVDPLVAERIAACLERISAGPRDPAGWLELGMVYHANWYPELAATCYEAAVALDGSSARAWFLLATVRDMGGHEGAIDAMRRAAALQPKFAPAHWRLGLQLLDAGRVPEAEQAFLRATDADPTDPAAWFGMARALALQDRAAEAAEIIELRLLHGPHAAYARHTLAAVNRQLGRGEPPGPAAAPAMLEPPWRDPWLDEVASRRTGLHVKQRDAEILIHYGRYDEAIDVLESLRVRWPDSLEVRNDLALALARAGRADDAQAILDAILAERPGHPATLANRATIRLGAAPSRAELAASLADADRALEASPGFAAAHEARGRILFAMQEFAPASEAFRAAVRCDARRGDLLVEAGRSAIALRRFGEAALDFQAAIDRGAALDQAWLGLGVARLETGDRDGAAAALAQAARLIRPGDPAYPVLQQRLDMLRRATPARPAAGGDP
jgi:tetratricopeptide (TPR) repeat protein